MTHFDDVFVKISDELPLVLRNNLVLVGSATLYSQGVAVTPKKDIDFATNYATVQELYKIFGDRVTKFCPLREGDDYLPFSYLFINIDGYEIEFFDATDYGESYYFGAITDENTTKLPNLVVKGLDLETELTVYRKSGKEEKIKAIEVHLNS